MLPRISAISVLALTVLAAATPTPITLDVRGGEPTVTKTITVTAPGPTKTITAGDCTTGPIQCCNSVQEASSQEVTSILGLLGIVLNDLTALVGLQCSPISIIGIVGGGACSAQPVCCENNSVNSIISIGCIPIFL